MVQMAIDGDRLHLRMRGIDQILALRSELSVPLAHIRAVTIRPAEAHGWFHGLRFGTNLPGVVTAGTFLTGDGLVFWDVHDPDKTIAIDIRPRVLQARHRRSGDLARGRRGPDRRCAGAEQGRRSVGASRTSTRCKAYSQRKTGLYVRDVETVRLVRDERGWLRLAG